ncbi:MAG: RNA-directed DNA polymerase [Alistipes sp.]|nr:RNA-directed DNA polymerase [Alistipes sp.]
MLIFVRMREPLDDKLLQDVFKAYFDARRNKRNTYNQLRFEMDLEHNLVELTRQIQERTYEVGPSVCFIVDYPVKREIFAADFRDRVVHHLIFNYLNAFFDSRLIEDCYSCRKGYGTSRGIDRFEHHMRSVSRNYTRQAYVLKLDLRGYFMSMNRMILYRKLEKMLTSRKNRRDKQSELELYLVRKVVYADPVDGCRVRGKMEDWEGLPPAKSLFHTPQDCGVPIGNLTSQLFSNIYMCDFDNWVKRELKIKHYGRYVDDFFLMHEDKHVLIDCLARIKRRLKEVEQLEVHPNKIYLQEVCKGVNFLGAFMKPYRRYIRKSVLHEIRTQVRLADRHAAMRGLRDAREIASHRSRLNSYLGYMAQFKTYKARKELWEECGNLRNYFYINTDYTKVTTREESRIEQEIYEKDNYLNR